MASTTSFIAVIIALILFSLTAAPLVSAVCPTVQGMTLKSDVDGTGPSPYPTGTCKWIITCPLDSAVVITQFAGRKSAGDGWFTMNIKPRLFNTDLIVYDPPYQNDWTVTNLPFYTNEISVDYKDEAPDAANPAGGFSMAWRCQKSCTLLDSNPTSFTPTGNARRGTYTLEKSASATEPEVCTVNIGPMHNCYAYEMVAYDMVSVPVFDPSGKVDPGWRVIFGPGDDPMKLGIYPNDYAARELFYSPLVAPLIIRSLPNRDINVSIDFYCTPVANCSVTPKNRMDYPLAAILSDPDGRGPLEYGPQPLDCTWDLHCPYDTNVWMHTLNGGLNPGQDFVGVSPYFGLGMPASYSRRSLPGVPLPISWRANVMSVRFKANRNTGYYPGFTLKYECQSVCAVASPQRKVLKSAKGSIAATNTAPVNGSSMCRTEAIPQCADYENSLMLSIVKQPSLGTDTWNLVVDHAEPSQGGEFEFTFPNTSLPNEIYIPATPFNVSVRAYPNYTYDYQIDYECQNTTMCWQREEASSSSPQQQHKTEGQEDGSGTIILPWRGGLILSDADGQGQQPYGKSNCTWNVRCTRGSSIAVDSINGAIRTSDSLTVGTEAPLSGSLTVSTFAVNSREMTVRFVADAPGPFERGFRLKFSCIGPDPFCGVAENCSSNAESATLSPDGSGCHCECRNQWTGKKCLNCASNYNQSADCGGCAIGYGREFPDCYPFYFVETFWQLRLENSQSANFTRRQQYGLAKHFAADLSAYLDATINCTKSTPGLRDRSSVRVGPLAIVEYSWTQLEVPVTAHDPTDAYLASQCVEDALSRTRGGSSSSFATPQFTKYLKQLDPDAPASATEYHQYTRRTGICDEPGTHYGCPPPAFFSAAPVDNLGLLVGGVVGGVLGLLLCILLFICLLKFFGVAFKDKEWPVFNEASKNTKGFGFVMDDELVAMSTKRDMNDENSAAVLDDPLLAPSSAVANSPAVGAAAAATGKPPRAGATASQSSSPPRQAQQPQGGLDIDDLFGDGGSNSTGAEMAGSGSGGGNVTAVGDDI